jgi:hypothetical protein
MASPLYQVLTAFAPNRIGLGDNFDPMGLQRALNALGLSLRRMYWLTATMVGLVFAVEITVALFYLHEPSVLMGLAAAIGVTIWGAVDRMGRLAHEMAETNLLVILGDKLTPEMLGRIVQALVDGLRRDKARKKSPSRVRANGVPGP